MIYFSCQIKKLLLNMYKLFETPGFTPFLSLNCQFPDFTGFQDLLQLYFIYKI